MKKINIREITEFLLKCYKERNWDEDFNKLNNKKLSLLLSKMNLPADNITILKGGINFKLSPYKDYISILNIKEEDYKDLIEDCNFLLNHLFEKCTSVSERFFDGMLTCNKTLDLIIKNTDFNSELKVINSHTKQIVESYKNSIDSVLKILYYVDLLKIGSENIENKKYISLNFMLNDVEEKLFNLRLDESDYI